LSEDDWAACTDLAIMLDFLRGIDRVGRRKFTLLMAACCRRIWQHFTTPGNREVVELLERVADDPSCTVEFTDACVKATAFAESEEGRLTEVGCSAASAAASVVSYPGEHAAWVATRTADCCRNTLYWAAHEVVEAAEGANELARASGEAAEHAEEATQAILIRDIFGPLPFRSVTLPPSVKAWNDGCIVKLATGIYEERSLPVGALDSQRIAVLADALEEAGCTDPDLLGHLRQQGVVHVRGCFVLDLLLGRA
jgi:hypothetical protein